MGNLKRLITFFLLVTILVVAAVGCSSQTKGEDGKVQTLTLGTWGVSDNMAKAVEEYNESQDKYVIEIKDYGKYDNYESDNPADATKGATMLNMDIATGKIPDIINTMGIDRTYYARNDALINIYDFMKSDKDFSKDSILSNYLTANEVDGGLYWLSPTFFVDTLIVNKDLSNGLEKWSTKEFVDISKATKEDNREIMQDQDPVHYMTYIGAGNQFVSAKNKTVQYDNPVYAEALDFSAELTTPQEDREDWDKWINEDAKKYQNGERLLVKGYIRDYNEYMSYSKLFGEQPTTMIGYPTLDGSSGHYFGMGLELYSISASSSAPEAAWDFVKSTLNVDVENTDAFPVKMDKLEEKLQKSITEYTDGNYTTNKGVNLRLDKPTQEDLDTFLTMLKSIDGFANYESSFAGEEIYGILDDFYAGSKSATEVSEILQDKYTLYFKEN